MGATVISDKAMADEAKRNITQAIQDFGSRLKAFIRQRVSGAEDAEDIFQDVFYQLAAQTEPIASVGSWLYTVARNKITDSYRKHRLPLANDVLGGAGEDDEFFDWQEILLSDQEDAETLYLRNIFWDEFYAALEELPSEQRDVFILNEMEDVPFKKISEMTGVSVPTLISRKRYAVLHLRNRLRELRDQLLNF